jgi:hypothetical protein
VQNFLTLRSQSSTDELAVLGPDVTYVPAFREFLKTNFRVYSITPAQSEEMCLCQVADLFAGLACYSREHARAYSRWSADQEYGELLFEEHRTTARSSDRERFPLLGHLQRCVERTAVTSHFG